MKKVLLNLLFTCTPIILSAAHNPRLLPLSLCGALLKPQNIERPHPVIKDAIDLERREKLSGKRYGELLCNAHEKRLPGLLFATRKITQSYEVVMDYLDGYTILDNTASSSSSLHDRINDFLQEMSKKWHCMAMCTHTLLVYPNTAHLKGISDILLQGTVNGQPFNEFDSVANIHCNTDSSDTLERLKLATIYQHQLQIEQNLGNKIDPNELKHTATIFAFWANQLDLTEHPDLAKSLQSAQAYLAEN